MNHKCWNCQAEFLGPDKFCHNCGKDQKNPGGESIIMVIRRYFYVVWSFISSRDAGKCWHCSADFAAGTPQYCYQCDAYQRKDASWSGVKDQAFQEPGVLKYCLTRTILCLIGFVAISYFRNACNLVIIMVLAAFLLRKVSWSNLLKAPAEVGLALIYLALLGVLMYYDPNFFAGAFKWALVLYVVTLWPCYIAEKGTGIVDIYPWYPATAGLIAMMLCLLQLVTFIVPIVTGHFTAAVPEQVGIDFSQYQDASETNWVKSIVDSFFVIFPQFTVWWEKFLSLFGLPPIGVFGNGWKTATLFLSSIIFVVLVVSTNIGDDYKDRCKKAEEKGGEMCRFNWRRKLELAANISEIAGRVKSSDKKNKGGK